MELNISNLFNKFDALEKKFVHKLEDFCNNVINEEIKISFCNSEYSNTDFTLKYNEEIKNQYQNDYIIITEKFQYVNKFNLLSEFQNLPVNENTTLQNYIGNNTKTDFKNEKKEHEYKLIQEYLFYLQESCEKFHKKINTQINQNLDYYKSLLFCLAEIKKIHKAIISLGVAIYLHFVPDNDDNSDDDNSDGISINSKRSKKNIFKIFYKTPSWVYKVILIICSLVALITCFIVHRPFVCKEKQDKLGLRGISKNIYHTIESKFVI